MDAYRYREAAGHYRAALRCAQSHGVAEDRAETMVEIANACTWAYEFGEAVTWDRRAIHEAARWPDVSPDFVPDRLAAIVANCAFEGRFHEANLAARQMHALDDARLKPNDVKRLDHILADAKLASRTGRHAEAIALAKQYLAIARQSTFDQDTNLAIGDLELGCAYAGAAKYAEAEASVATGLAAFQKQKDPNPVAIGRAQAVLASIDMKQRRVDLALRLFQQGIGNLEKSIGSEHPSMAEIYTRYADALLKAGRPAEAAAIRSKAGRAPDREAAIRIAEAAWTRVYGRANIDRQRPIQATLDGEVWRVHGSLPKGQAGGVADAVVSRKTGRVLHMGHGR
jgi:tetratricopeptide (TPR) repeat protein